MDPDDRVRTSLRRVADAIQPDVDESFEDLRGRAQPWASSRRVVAVALAAAVVAAIALLTQQLARHEGRPAPVSPTPGLVVRHTFTAASLGIGMPLDVALAPDGTFYVSDDTQHVSAFSDAGELLHRWGGRGTESGQFRLVTGALAVGADGRVYVADTGNARVQVFSPSGRFLAEYGHFGTGAGFLSPTDIAVGDSGEVYVADRQAASLTKLAPDGTFGWELGRSDTTPDSLVGHVSLGGVVGGRLAVTNTDTHQVLQLGPDGGVLTERDLPNACDASSDSADRLYVLDCDPTGTPTGLEIVAGKTRTAVKGVGPFTTAPRWNADGDGAALSSSGDVVLAQAVPNV
jgi:DNA-binding beta-propeller fold protein YncE